ncbi:3'-5' exonuclease [bacterium]|nr:3'-5' exonuclease [bacterium]MBQ4437656.1 3'-5' exonuclease [bacterium]
MQNRNVTVFDLETTGLSPSCGDRITEIGAIKLSGNKLCGVFQTLVNPGRKIPEKIVEITGITNEMVADKPTISQVLPLFMDFVQDDLIAAHNAKFDTSFLHYELKECGINKNFETYCTLLASRKEVKTSANFRLSTLKNHFNLKPMGAMHRALSDAYVTAQLYLKLTKNWGTDTMSQFEKEVELLMNSMDEDDIYLIDPKIC